MLPVRTIDHTDADEPVFAPTVIASTRPAIDIVALMAMAVRFEGYDEPDASIEPEPMVSIWDEALDIRLASL